MAKKSLLTNQTSLTDYITDRLANTSGAAEGSTLLPRQRGAGRIPIVTGLKITQISNYLGGSEFTLVWNNPQTSASLISGFNIYVVNALTQNQSPLQVGQVDASPAKVRVVGSQASVLTFFVQTVLSSGAVSSLDNSPSCTAQVAAPVITGGDVGTITVATIVPGGANQIMGTSPTGAVNEFKTFTGAANQVALAFGGGTVSFGLAQQVSLQALATPPTTTNNNFTASNSQSSVFANAASSSFTITMPPSPIHGQILIVKRIDSSANTVTLAGNTGQTMETSTLGALNSLILQYDISPKVWRTIAKF